MRFFIVLPWLLFNGLPGVSLAQSADSVAGQEVSREPRAGFFSRFADTLVAGFTRPVAPKPLSWKAVAIPTVLIGYGTISVTTDWFNNINLLGRKWASNNEDPDRHTKVDDYTEFVPAGAYYALQLAGVPGKHNVVDATFMYIVSEGLAHAVTVPLKRISARTRPDSSDQLSFPSGHTSTAFVSAEFLRQEYKDVSPWIAVGGYSMAVLTGFLRMYNNKHWFADVVTGAGVGILSTRAAYWLYPKAKNLLLGKRVAGNAMLLPTYSDGMAGVYFVWRLP